MARKASKTSGVKIRPAVYEGRTPRAAVPTRANRRANKPSFEGLTCEEAMRLRLEHAGFIAHRRPGQRSYRLSTYGRAFVPDMAMTLFGLEQFGIEEAPNMLTTWRAPANMIIEVKRQTVDGSAATKIGPALRDLAHMSDVTNTLGMMIMDVTVFDKAQWKHLRHLADAYGVILLTKEQLTKRKILSEVRRVATLRANLRKKFYAGTKKPKPRYAQHEDVLQFLTREAERRSLGYK